MLWYSWPASVSVSILCFGELVLPVLLTSQEHVSAWFCMFQFEGLSFEDTSASSEPLLGWIQGCGIVDVAKSSETSHHWYQNQTFSDVWAAKSYHHHSRSTCQTSLKASGITPPYILIDQASIRSEVIPPTSFDRRTQVVKYQNHADLNFPKRNWEKQKTNHHLLSLRGGCWLTAGCSYSKRAVFGVIENP